MIIHASLNRVRFDLMNLTCTCIQRTDKKWHSLTGSSNRGTANTFPPGYLLSPLKCSFLWVNPRSFGVGLYLGVVRLKGWNWALEVSRPPFTEPNPLNRRNLTFPRQGTCSFLQFFSSLKRNRLVIPENDERLPKASILLLKISLMVREYKLCTKNSQMPLSQFSIWLAEKEI